MMFRACTYVKNKPKSLLRLTRAWLPAIDDVIKDVRMNLWVREVSFRLSQDDREGFPIAAQDLCVPAQHVRFDALEQHHALHGANLFESLVLRPRTHGQLVDDLLHFNEADTFHLILPRPGCFEGRTH